MLCMLRSFEISYGPIRPIVDKLNYMHIVRLMTRLTLISLDDTVVFPGMPVTLALDAGNDKHIFLMPRHGNTYAKVGVVAEVTERVQLPGRGYAVSLKGLHRGVPGAAQTDADGRLRVNVEERPDIVPAPTETHELEREYRAVVEEILELRGDDAAGRRLFPGGARRQKIRVLVLRMPVVPAHPLPMNLVRTRCFDGLHPQL